MLPFRYDANGDGQLSLDELADLLLELAEEKLKVPRCGGARAARAEVAREKENKLHSTQKLKPELNREKELKHVQDEIAALEAREGTAAGGSLGTRSLGEDPWYLG